MWPLPKVSQNVSFIFPLESIFSIPDFSGNESLVVGHKNLHLTLDLKKKKTTRDDKYTQLH